MSDDDACTPSSSSSLTGGLAAALVFGYLTQRVGLSPIVGYRRHRDTLAQAGITEAANLVLTSAGMTDGRETIAQRQGIEFGDPRSCPRRISPGAAGSSSGRSGSRRVG